jgi:hypothetical protein
MVTKAYLRDARACREMYFSAGMDAHEVARLQRLLAQHASPLPVIDVRPARARLAPAYLRGWAACTLVVLEPARL